MSTWVAINQFQGQREQMAKQSPNPAVFSEGNSYWIEQYPIDFEDEWAEKPLPQEPVDVIIVGSGITGATVAYQLSKLQPDLRVAVVEARGLCTGATGRNGGHISRPEVHGLRELKEKLGAEDAVRFKALMMRTRDMMIETAEELQITDKVELSMGETIVTFKAVEQREAYVKELELAKELNYEAEAVLISPKELIKSGTVYPRKFVAELFRHALEKMPNLTLHPYTPAFDVKRDYTKDLPYSVETKRGTISARAVFHATNVYASSILPSLTGEQGVFACSCHVMAVRPESGTKQLSAGYGWDDMWYWIAPQPNNGPWIYGYSFTETIGDYDDSKGLPQDHEHRPQMYKFLEDQFPQHFPKIEFENDVTHNWTGIQGYTDSGASFVGRPLKESPGEFMCVGHNGEGMTRCFSTATVATEAMLNYLNGGKPEDYTPPEWLPQAYRYNL